jgi:hypothetical protein
MNRAVGLRSVTAALAFSMVPVGGGTEAPPPGSAATPTTAFPPRHLAAGTEASPPGPLAPPSGALFGAYVKPLTGWSRPDVEVAVQALESALGRTLGIDHHYYRWQLPFPSWKEPWDFAHGRIPMISWGPISTRRVNSGALDDVIRERARGIRALGHPVFLRWFYEMDGVKLAAPAGSPASYIRAWRRIRWIFASQGAWNAVWVWCPNAWGFKEGVAPRWYPGDQYVDWVCADGYNWAPGRPGDGWRMLEEIFDRFYEFGVASGKPMMIAEYGCQERGPGEKAAWIDVARETLKTRFPEIGAVVYFNSKGDYDWRVESSPSSLEAFAAMGADPHFNPDASTLGAVDPSRFDAVLGDNEGPRLRVERARLRAGRKSILRWISDEPHADWVKIRYDVRRGRARFVVRRTTDDGRFRWAVPRSLKEEHVRLIVQATDLAGNRGRARSRWIPVR